MDLVFFGMQGSGKGTQAKFVAEKFNLKIFETGAELRRLAKEDSELGGRIAEVLAAGKHVSPDIVMDIVRNFIEGLQPGESALFDGIPRNKIQKEAFDKLLQEMGRNFTSVLIELSEEEALKRLLARGRNDDNEEAIAMRIKLYKEKTMPIVESYAQSGQMIRIQGEQSIEAVTQDMLDALAPLF